MKVLVVGSGGREHALIWKILESPEVDKVYCAPGNGGIAGIAKCVNIEATDIKGLAQFAKRKGIGLTVVGPELPLTMGIVDYFKDRGLTIFGPDKLASEIEGSKTFAKDFMKKYHIPTAEYTVFTDYDAVVRAIHEMEPPVVLKADGLAAGKGVFVCMNRGEAFDGVDRIMKKRVFGQAGESMIVEEFLSGEEASLLAMTDGDNLVILPGAQDHKAIFEGDIGPNTGGMGAYAPPPVINEKMLEIVKEKIFIPTIRGMKAEGRNYSGVLYVGLMITSQGPKVLEFNCRFGDPEIQAILPLVETDFVDLMLATIQGRLNNYQLQIKNMAAVCVVMASGGYPGFYEKGKTIHGLDRVDPDILIFHAGTKVKGRNLVTSGGRVLGITAYGETIKSAVQKVYRSIGNITFDGAYYRRDIGHRALTLNKIKSPSSTT